ncbi:MULTISPECIES: DUF2273 domain-containing protein [unclassified Cellulomonas]|jgi:uncharacterized membrane protein|uniref:DUF2273 domain-containing protein n=1 Tax=unclassified Cellulomonas TaxID=2620175 RepID=UPI001C2F9DF9|nr:MULTISPECIES: DUF2273 domain-containing protein [unclassified Cellulomonas]MBW0253469.1 DUF2273 domain-containing protein [Cellulomonas sp. PS-H5]HYQ73572.1 DUF2273 domain-containing protein [Cellulomonas sp.]
MSSMTTTGLLAGLLLAVAITTGGLVGFLLALVLGGLGLVVGAHADGRIDLGAVLGGRRRG